MADSTVARSQHHTNPKPIARPRRTRSKSSIQFSNSDDASHDRPFQDNAKPERPSVPPRPNFSKLREVAKRADNPTVHPATPSSTRQRQASLENHTKSPALPRSVGPANALMRPQSKSGQLQRRRSKSSSGTVDSRLSNGSLKQRQALSNKPSDPGHQGHTRSPIPNIAKVSQSQSPSSPERKVATSTTISPNHSTAHKQSPARPKPPLPANRPSIPPTPASKPGSSTARQNRRPSRPPTLPKTAAAVSSLSPSKTVPSSLYLYGSTLSLPAVPDSVAKSREVANKPKSFDDSSMRLNGPMSKAGSDERRSLKVASSSNGYKTLPKNYGRKSVVWESHRQQISSKTSDAQHRKRVPPAASTSVHGALTSTRHSGLDGQRVSSTLPRKTPPQQNAKIPPKRPPPAIRDRSRPAVVVTNPPLHKSPLQVEEGANSTRYVTFPSTNHEQQRQQPQCQFPEDHIYMEVGQVGYQANASSWPSESGGNVEAGTSADRAGATAEYPYVIMTRADSAVHIYTALTSDTTDDAEDYDLVVPGSDLPASQPKSLAAESNGTDHESVKFAINGEESNQHEETASQTNALQPQQLDDTVLDDKLIQDYHCLAESGSDQPKEKDDPSTQHPSAEGESQTAADQLSEEESEYYNQALSVSGQPKEKDDPSTQHACAEEESPAAADQQIGEESEYHNHLGQEQDVKRECSQPHPQPQCWDNQQSTTTGPEINLKCYQAAGEGTKELQAVDMKQEGGQPERELKDNPEQALKLEENRVELNHTAQCHSETHLENTDKESNVKFTDEECKQQSRLESHNASTNFNHGQTKQSEDTIIGEYREAIEVMDATSSSQGLDSPLDQELPDYYNVDAAYMNIDELIT